MLKLSISLITYNQEKYISEALDSILRQKTDFDFEIIIGDDASTDKTSEIIESYLQAYENIRFLKNDENLGIQKNISNVFKNCQGEYIALLEGDDYWLDENKLQKQVDFLDNNKNCVACFTDSYTFIDGDFATGEYQYQNKKIIPKVFDLDYFLTNTIHIPNNSKMFRKSSLPENLPEIFYKYIQWDWLLHVIQGVKGDFGFINSVSLAYRRHPKATISSKNYERILTEAINLLYEINSYIPERYWKYFKHPLYEMNKLAWYYLKERKFGLFIKWYFKWFRSNNMLNVNWRDQFWYLRRALKRQEF